MFFYRPVCISRGWLRGRIDWNRDFTRQEYLLTRRGIGPLRKRQLVKRKRESQIWDWLSRFALDALPQSIQALTP